MFNIIKYANRHTFSKIGKNIQQICLYFDCMYSKTNLYRITDFLYAATQQMCKYTKFPALFIDNLNQK